MRSLLFQKRVLEKIESVELLRALERGYRIMAVEVSESQSVDVLEELEAVRKLMKNDELRKKY